MHGPLAGWKIGERPRDKGFLHFIDSTLQEPGVLVFKCEAPLPDPPPSPPEGDEETADEDRKVSMGKRDLVTHTPETPSEAGKIPKPAPHLSDTAEPQATERLLDGNSSRKRRPGLYPYEIPEPRALQEIALRTTPSNRPKGLDEIVRVPSIPPEDQPHLGASPMPHANPCEREPYPLGCREREGAQEPCSGPSGGAGWRPDLQRRRRVLPYARVGRTGLRTLTRAYIQ